MGDENKSKLSVALPVSVTRGGRHCHGSGGIGAQQAGGSRFSEYTRKDQGKRRAVLRPMALSTTLCGLIGWSRIYLGVHHPSDVLAGWIAGTTWLLTCSLASKYMSEV